MPRQSRIDAAGALHHIIVRGIERRKIFADDQDRFAFLSRFARIIEQTQTSCYAWALLPNHFHLLLRTGAAPVATVMRRLLTGHAIHFNRRHKRAGHLFQNRYKSILCQEDAYFSELVRYIHLNPLRSRLVKDLGELDVYPFSGHSALMGKQAHSWQHCKAVLERFGQRTGSARRSYRDYVEKGIDQGRRADLTGGGLIRSNGGWAAVKAARKAKIHVKSDERILGDGDFVALIMSEAEDAFERGYALKARGVDADYLAAIVSGLLDVPVEEIWRKGRYRSRVAARSLICFWAVRELGMSMTNLARRFGISTVAVSKSVQRGAEIVKNEGYCLDKLIS